MHSWDVPHSSNKFKLHIDTYHCFFHTAGAAKRDLASKYVRRIHNIAGRRRMQNRPRAVGGARAQAAANHVAFAFNEGASASDLEQDRVKAASLPPARVEIGRGQKLVSQISCGLQHTGET